MQHRALPQGWVQVQHSLLALWSAEHTEGQPGGREADRLKFVLSEALRAGSM